MLGAPPSNFRQPSVLAIARHYDCNFEDIQTEVFLNLVRCQPKKPKLLRQQIQQLEIEDE